MTSSPELPNPTPNHARLMQLDVLRGLAILLVLCRHGIVPSYDAGPLHGPMHFLERIGWTGVDLFFVLSGFLIGGLLFIEIRKTGRLDVRRFFIRRALKIWPAYVVFLLAAALIDMSRHGPNWAFRHLLPNVFHLQNYIGNPSYVTSRGITWSLAVEEHFYLALPLFLLLLIPWRRRDGSMPAVPIAAATLIVACTALRFANWNHPFEMYRQFTPTHLRIDGLFFGVLLAYLFHIKPSVLQRIARHRLALLGIGIALLLPLGFRDLEGPHNQWIWTIGFTMIYLGYGCILIACLYSPPGDLFGNLLASRPAAAMAWIGIFSYSIYLWQFDISYDPINWWLLPHLPQHPRTLYWLLGTTIYMLIAILGGAMLSRVIEFPVLKLRDRIFPARADAVPSRPVSPAPEPSESSLVPAAIVSN